MPRHSLVIPVFNEVLGVETLFKRVQNVIDAIEDPSEVILVNDGSTDGTSTLLDEIHLRDPRFKVVHFSRNFGHQIAITAGTEYATGDTVTVMDADLQDPPELIHTFLAKWREGYEVVYGVRRQREGETKFKLLTAKIFYRAIRHLTHLDIPVDTGDFRLIDRKVANAFLALPERHRYVRGLMSWVGFKQIGVPYDRATRAIGETHYPFKKMVKLAFDGVASFSIVPLRIATAMGFVASAVAFLGMFYICYLKFFTDRTIQGWSSLILVVLFLGGIQLVSLGILGEYIGRMFDEVRQRPLYFVTKLTGISQSSAANPSTTQPNRRAA